MKTFNLQEQQPSLAELLQAARGEPVLLVEPTGGEFLLSAADDFDAEVESLRKSTRFQAFLDRRMGEKKRIPIGEIERDIKRRLNRA